MAVTVLDEIKIRLNITGTFHDDLLNSFIDDVKAFMIDGGVPSEVANSEKSYGAIYRGVADLWNYGAGDGEFSTIFYQRVGQLAVKVGENNV